MDVRCVLRIIAIITVNDLNDTNLLPMVGRGLEEMFAQWFCGQLGLSSLSNQGRVGSTFPCCKTAPSRAVSAPRSSEPALLSSAAPGTPLQSLFSWFSAPSWTFLPLFLHVLMLFLFFVSGSVDPSAS